MGYNVVRPGFNLGAEYGIWDKAAFKTKVHRKKGSRQIIKAHQVILAGNTGLIWHPKTSTTWMSTATIEYRKTSKRRMQYQFGFGPGIARTFLPNTYEVSGNGVQKRFLAGHTYLAPYTFIGYGRYRKGARKLQFWSLRAGCHFLVPYNAFIIPYPTLELRLGFHKKPAQ